MDQWIGLWDENGLRMPADGPAIVEREAIRMAVRPLLENFSNDLTITCHEVRVSGDMALVHGTYKLKAATRLSMEDHVPRWTMKPSATTLVSGGRFLSVFLRQADGSWKLSHEALSSGTPSL